jgi:hypothetical protein
VFPATGHVVHGGWEWTGQCIRPRSCVRGWFSHVIHGPNILPGTSTHGHHLYRIRWTGRRLQLDQRILDTGDQRYMGLGRSMETLRDR